MAHWRRAQGAGNEARGLVGSTDIRRILCLHMNQIGDLLFSLPALYNVRIRFPAAHIASLVRPACKELLSLCGLVDEIIERPRGSDLRIAGQLRRGGLDLALLFSTSVGTWAIAQASGARIKAGFTHSLGGLLLDYRAPWWPPPSTANNLRLVEAIGCPIVKRDYVGLLTPGPCADRGAEQVLRSAGMEPGGSFAILGPGASGSRQIKRWSDEGFAEVADLLHERLGLRSLVVGLDGGPRICDLTKSAADLTGRMPLTTLAAILGRAKVFVGVDSGIMHLAAAMGTPVVGLFGPTDPKATGPQGHGHAVVSSDVSCLGCLDSSCKLGRPCMTEITPGMVVSAACAVLRRGSTDPPHRLRAVHS